MSANENFLNNFFEIMSVKTVTVDNRGVISDYSTISTEEDKNFMEQIAINYIFENNIGDLTEVHFNKMAFNQDLKSVFEISVKLNDKEYPVKYLFALVKLKNIKSYIDDIYSCPIGTFKVGNQFTSNNIWYEITNIRPWLEPLQSIQYADYELKPLMLPTIIENANKIDELKKLSKYANDEVSKAVLENKLKKFENHITIDELKFIELPLKRKVQIYLDELSDNNKSTKEKRELKAKLFEIFNNLIHDEV